MPKIVILDGYTENPGDLSWLDFEALGQLTVYDRTSPDQVISRIGDANIVYTNKTPLTRETLESCPNIEFIGVLATGYNVVDYVFAKEKNILVANIPTYGTTAVAQFAFGLILEVCHHIGHHAQEVSHGKWTTNQDWCFWDYPLIELAGKTIGIVGFGRIGQAVARIANAFEMNVLAYDEYPNEAGKKLADYVGLNELYERSDVISLHVPLFPSTNGMINAASISKMRKHVIIVNTSRGPLVNEVDLKIALDADRIAAYATDVVSSEPIQADNPLLNAKNCIITPHIAWAPKESRQRLMDIAVDNLSKYLAGTPINIVNL